MAKINLDKYYTDPSIVSLCLEELSKLNLPIIEYLEPSAGAGAFSNRLPNCLAYDIAPEHESIVLQDFLSLQLPYKNGRCVIGNPPFGTRNNLSIKFFKKAITLGDTVAFIQPASQFNNSQQLYEFDLVASILLPTIQYSGVNLLCCFNIYQRPIIGNYNTKAPDYTLKDITVLEYRRGGRYPKPNNYDFGMCSWGSIGKEVSFVGEFAQENYIVVNNVGLREKVISICKATDWKALYPCTSTAKIQSWKIYKYLKEQLPELV
jgi:hypothetical protein